jgi:7-keto-8-aminopelargonate synthetase-like enzyme
LRALGIAVPDGATANFGVAIGDAANMRRVHETLRAKRVMVPYVTAYTGVPPEGLLRFAVFANHTPEQVDRLVDELGSIL